VPALIFALILALTTPAASALSVRGNRLVDARGHTVRLLGVDISGTEDSCIGGSDFAAGTYGSGSYFRAPPTQRTVSAIKSWHANVARVPINESCWLGENVADAGAPYRIAVTRWVALLRRNHLYVIVDAHTATPSTDLQGRPQPALEILPMLDAGQGIPFWTSVAQTFRRDSGVLFDLYNEPHDISWSCWRDGCEIPAGVNDASNGEPNNQLHYPGYRAAGMAQLVQTIRATGATQPIMLGGLDFSATLDQWLAYRPQGDRQLVASVHTYGPASNPNAATCTSHCRSVLTGILGHGVPVVTGELGEYDCAHHYVDDYMKWADRHGVSYLGWAWDTPAPGESQCGGGEPNLIAAYNGTPTTEGRGLRDHLRVLVHR
jgi:hypothetical protein